MEGQPTIMAGCVIPDQEGRLLVLHRKVDKNRQHEWELPGGKAEPIFDEELADTAVREGGEELGVTVLLEQYLGRAAFNFEGRQFDYHFFRGRIRKEQVPDKLEKIFDTAEYKTLQELEKLNENGKLSAFVLHVVRSGWLNPLPDENVA